MKSLAQAVVDAAAFLELSGDDVVSPDAAVDALESIAAALSEATREEKKCVLDYCAAQAKALVDDASVGAAKRRAFYLGFEESFGLSDE